MVHKVLREDGNFINTMIVYYQSYQLEGNYVS